jgi:two-component system chemotaxis response regulator CheY
MKDCLLVDDSRIIRKVARKILEELSFTCREAEDGQKAIDACAAEMPDAILLDWNMPGMNGIECLKGVRALPGGARPKIVLCTTNNEMAHIMQGLAEGADEYIMKPFDSEIIQSKFAEVGLL